MMKTRVKGMMEMLPRADSRAAERTRGERVRKGTRRWRVVVRRVPPTM
jgi:hypothetical protein